MLDDVRRTTLAGASHMPITEQMTNRCRRIFTDLAVIDGQLVGRGNGRGSATSSQSPRHGCGCTRPCTCPNGSART